MLTSPPTAAGFLEVLCTGAASSAWRHVHTEPELVLDRGDYLGFHMDHTGVHVDGEMQVVIGYAPL